MLYNVSCITEGCRIVYFTMVAVIERGVGFREGCRIVCCIMLAVLERGVGL